MRICFANLVSPTMSFSTSPHRLIRDQRKAPEHHQAHIRGDDGKLQRGPTQSLATDPELSGNRAGTEQRVPRKMPANEGVKNPLIVLMSKAQRLD